MPTGTQSAVNKNNGTFGISVYTASQSGMAVSELIAPAPIKSSVMRTALSPCT